MLRRSHLTALTEVNGHATVVQSRALAIRRMLEARHSWIFSEGAPPVKGQKIVPQSISIAISAQQVLPRVAGTLAQDLSEAMQAIARRGQGGDGAALSAPLQAFIFLLPSVRLCEMLCQIER
ncbi:MAG: hypothetical protein AB7E21_04290 [Pseudodonghicola sp.]|uniref:hypothetical protein n=1 Tax=Pseudodonghicola sp. TaxID=1969463 RepID=UPI003A983E2B